MSYLVLARKWRPQTFADVVGQQAVVRTLQNAIKRQRVAHAMLFSGVRGVGKTTLARVMAKAINCQGDTDNPPCNQCDSCREITAGTAMDLHEIDGASNRGIQEIRELKENIRFFPSKARYKVIIIDEVHMLTTEAFNALLKTLEEPPAHVYFMFATTELHKIPVTILSRCQRYELQRVGFGELTAFFKKIAAAEKVAISDRALEMIAGEAEGSVRDGLSLLDQIFSFCGDRVEDEDVRQVLGLVDRNVIRELIGALLASDVAAAMEVLDRAYGAGLDLKRFTNDLLQYVRGLLVCRSTASPEKLLDLPDRELAEMRELAGSQSPETLYNLFQLLLQGADEMHHSGHPRLTLEMVLVRAAQSGQIVPVSTLLARLDTLLAAGPESPPAAGGGGGYGTRPPEPPRSGLAEPPPEPYQPKAMTAPAPPVAEPDPVRVAGAAAPKPAPGDVRKNWDDFVRYVKQRKQWMAHVLGLCSGVHEEAGQLVLKFDLASDCKILQEADNQKLLTEFAQDFFQREMRIKLGLPCREASGEAESDEVTPQEERRILGNDPLVQMTTEIFNGQVGGIRTGPRSR